MMNRGSGRNRRNSWCKKKAVLIIHNWFCVRANAPVLAAAEDAAGGVPPEPPEVAPGAGCAKGPGLPGIAEVVGWWMAGGDAMEVSETIGAGAVILVVVAAVDEPPKLVIPDKLSCVAGGAAGAEVEARGVPGVCIPNLVEFLKNSVPVPCVEFRSRAKEELVQRRGTNVDHCMR